MKQKRFEKKFGLTGEGAFWAYREGHYVYIRDELMAPKVLGNMTVKAVMAAAKKKQIRLALPADHDGVEVDGVRTNEMEQKGDKS